MRRLFVGRNDADEAGQDDDDDQDYDDANHEDNMKTSR